MVEEDKKPEDKKPLQPNCRCPFCDKPFYVSFSYMGMIDCMKCGSKFHDTEARI